MPMGYGESAVKKQKEPVSIQGGRFFLCNRKMLLLHKNGCAATRAEQKLVSSPFADLWGNGKGVCINNINLAEN
jgi:hypothetical protein